MLAEGETMPSLLPSPDETCPAVVGAAAVAGAGMSGRLFRPVLTSTLKPPLDSDESGVRQSRAVMGRP